LGILSSYNTTQLHAKTLISNIPYFFVLSKEAALLSANYYVLPAMNHQHRKPKISGTKIKRSSKGKGSLFYMF
jgi:hypothetical protein